MSYVDRKASRDASGRDVIALRHWATIAGIALIVLIIAADSYEAWQDYRRVIADNERIQTALSRALVEQTARMVQEIDVLLESYALWASTESNTVTDDAKARQRLLAQLERLPFIQSAVVAGPDGEVLAKTSSGPLDAGNLKNHAAFAVPASTAGNALHVDRTFDGDGTSSRSFALSRRVVSPTGAFSGVVIARVAFDYLARFYAQVNVAPDTTIRLARADGATLAQYPSGLTSTPAPEVSRRIVASQPVEDYPIVVQVSRSLSSVLQPWIEEERSSAARTLTLAVLATILLVALRSALRRQERLNDDRYRLEQELAGNQRVEALGFLAASVAHDFNNVLTAIIGYAELARETVQIQSSASNIDRLLAATDRARLLVRRVLTFDPHRSLVYRPTLIEPIVREVSFQVEATLPPSIDMEVAIVDAPVISGDATEIYQVIVNLCSNAVHAMAGGGLLEIVVDTLDTHEPRPVALGRLFPGRWARVTIADSGVGLADTQISSIFEPFYTTRQATLGTGIGLTVVRNIILRMGGALDVDSRLGEGTRMAVYWPIIAATIDAPSADRLEEGTGETILVVDDEPELVILTEELLASLSYEPVGFSDARAALETFRADPQRFDAILTDERMHPMGGLELSKRIHRLRPDLPIILMTGHRDAEIDIHAKEAGITDILDKPLRVQMLRDALARQLRAAKK